MVAIHAPIEKTRTYTPVWEKAVFTSARGLARRQYRQVRLNDLSPLWPENQLRAQAIHFAKQFVRDMEKQGFQLLSNEGDITISGPYEPRAWDKALDGTFKGKRHVRMPTPDGRVDVEINLLPSQPRVDPRLADKEDFLLQAQFVSTRTVRVEHAIKEPTDGR